MFANGVRKTVSVHRAVTVVYTRLSINGVLIAVICYMSFGASTSTEREFSRSGALMEAGSVLRYTSLLDVVTLGVAWHHLVGVVATTIGMHINTMYLDTSNRRRQPVRICHLPQQRKS